MCWLHYFNYTNLFIAAEHSISEEVSTPTKDNINPTQVDVYSTIKAKNQTECTTEPEHHHSYNLLYITV